MATRTKKSVKKPVGSTAYVKFTTDFEAKAKTEFI